VGIGLLIIVEKGAAHDVRWLMGVLLTMVSESVLWDC
jgi:hypothetical protein